jgi:hypothetical protein
MPVLAMHVLVCNFLGGGGPYGKHFEREAQRLAAQGVIAIEQYGRPFDLGDKVVTRFSIRAGALDLAPHLDAWWEVSLGHGSYQCLIAIAKGVLGSEVPYRDGRV